MHELRCRIANIKVFNFRSVDKCLIDKCKCYARNSKKNYV